MFLPLITKNKSHFLHRIARLANILTFLAITRDQSKRKYPILSQYNYHFVSCRTLIRSTMKNEKSSKKEHTFPRDVGVRAVSSLIEVIACGSLRPAAAESSAFVASRCNRVLGCTNRGIGGKKTGFPRR